MLKLIERSITLQLLIFYILFILPLVLIGAALYGVENDSWQRRIQQTNLSLDQSAALTIGAAMQSVSKEAITLAATPEAKHLDAPALASLFQDLAATSSDDHLSIVCDPSGKVVLTSPFDQATERMQFHSLAYFQAALVSSKPIIGPVQPGTLAHSLVVPVALRILNQGKVAGVLIIDEPFTSFTSPLVTIQHHLPGSDAIGIGLIDRSGKWLAGTDDLSAWVGQTASPALGEALFESLPTSQLVREWDRDWLYSLVPIEGTTWTAIVRQSADVAFAPLMNLQHSLLIALAMLLVGAGLFWIVMHGWAVAPLSRLARVVTLIKPNQTEKITESKLIARELKRTDEIGQLTAAFSAMEDEIHQRFRESDKESQARLHTLDAILQSMHEGVLLESPHGQIVYANHSFTRFLGISLPEAHLDTLSEYHLTEKLLAMMVDPDAYQEALYLLKQGAGSQSVEFQTRGYYNRMNQWIPVRRDVRIRLFEVRDRLGELIGRGKIFNDVTRHNEAELIKKNLLAIVSHELRTPLTAIKGYATSLLETDVELESSLQKHFLRRIVEEEDRMAELVTSLLEMSQLEAGTLKLSPGWHHLSTILEQIVQTNEQKTIHLHIPADLPAFYIDRRRLEMVMRNLVDNAWCYGGPETVIDILATHQRKGQDDGLYVSVIDNGPGLPPDLTERIFEHFYQVDGGRKRSKSGVGLGLAICRGFVEAHGGRIWAENRSDGKTGAVFRIWLPPGLLHTSDSQLVHASQKVF